MERKNTIAILGLVVSLTILLVGNNLVGRLFSNEDPKEEDYHNDEGSNVYLIDSTFSCDGTFMLSNDSKRVGSQLVHFKDVVGNVDQMFINFEGTTSDSLRKIRIKVIVELEKETVFNESDFPALTINYESGGQTYMVLNIDYPKDVDETSSIHYSSNNLDEEIRNEIILNQIESIQLHSSICTAVIINNESPFGYRSVNDKNFIMIGRGLKCLVQKKI